MVKKLKAKRTNDGHGASGLTQPKNKTIPLGTMHPKVPKGVRKLDTNKGDEFGGPSRLTKHKLK